MSDEFAPHGDAPTPDTAPTPPATTPDSHLPPAPQPPEASACIHDPLLNTLLAQRYTIHRRLARGGMATVYVAHDERLDRHVAIKVMHPHLAEDQQFIARFDREARSAARICHPAIVSVTDQGNVDGRPYLVMDLIDGPNLRDLLRSQGAFSLGQALNYTRDVLHALRAAARENVIHRDIKPENVMIPSDGPARVTDFGLAKAVSEATMSATSNMLGTVTYMAPEIATTGKADARTDLYSLGIMLYEMLTGAVPWHGDNALHIAYSHVHDDVPSPSTEQPWIPREVDDFVAALTARKPDERPATAAEALMLLDRLHAALPCELLGMRAAVSGVGEGVDTQVLAQMEAGLAPTTFLPPLASDGAGAAPVPGGELAEGIDGVTPFGKGAGPAGGAVVLANEASVPNSPAEVLIVPEQSADGSVASVGGNGQLPAYEAVPFGDMDEAGPAAAAPSRRRRLWLIVLLVVGLLAGVAAGGTWWWFEMGPGAYVQLPATDSRPADEVRAELEKLGFSVVENQEFSDDVPTGHVIASDPASATSAHKDSVITLRVSKGVDLRVVPNVIGKMREEADRLIAEVGLTVGTVEEVWSEEIPAGQVISQAQDPESTLRVQSAVDFTVSRGREPRTVPELAGKTRDEVNAALTELALTPDYIEEFSDSVPEGGVISQETPAGTQLFKGDKVTVKVSKGPELVAVPEILGMSRQDAVNALEAAGFQVEVSYVLGGVLGTAHSTDPRGGTMVKKGSTVTLTVV